MKRYERNSGITLITLIITIVILIIISGVVIGSTLGEDKTVDKTLETRIDVTKREITKAIGLYDLYGEELSISKLEADGIVNSVNGHYILTKDGYNKLGLELGKIGIGFESGKDVFCIDSNLSVYYIDADGKIYH